MFDASRVVSPKNPSMSSILFVASPLCEYDVTYEMLCTESIFMHPLKFTKYSCKTLVFKEGSIHIVAFVNKYSPSCFTIVSRSEFSFKVDLKAENSEIHVENSQIHVVSPKKQPCFYQTEDAHTLAIFSHYLLVLAFVCFHLAFHRSKLLLCIGRYLLSNLTKYCFRMK